MPAPRPTGFRIPDDVKTAAAAEAARRGVTLTDVVVNALRAYGDAPAAAGRTVTVELTPAQAALLGTASAMWTPLTVRNAEILARARTRLAAAIRAADPTPEGPTT